MRRFVKWETPLMASTASVALLVVGLLQQQQDQQVQQPRRPNGPQPSPDAVAASPKASPHHVDPSSRPSTAALLTDA